MVFTCHCGCQSLWDVFSTLYFSRLNSLQYSCLESPMDGGAWWAAVHGVSKSRTRLSDFTFTFYFHALEEEMATHSSVLAWRIPGTGEPGGLPSMESHRVGHDWSDLAAAAAAAVELDHPFSPSLWHQHSWFLRVWTWTDQDFDICSLGSAALEFGLKQHHQLSWDSSSQVEIVGLLSIHNCVSQYFIAAILLNIYMYSTCSFSLANILVPKWF